jgi:hypothetical protein
VNDFGERAEFLEQRLGQWLDVALGFGREQHHLEQFIVVQRVGSCAVKALTQPLTMAVVMRRLGGLGLAIVGLRGHGTNHAVAVSFCNRELSNCHARVFSLLRNFRI